MWEGKVGDTVLTSDGRAHKVVEIGEKWHRVFLEPIESGLPYGKRFISTWLLLAPYTKEAEQRLTALATKAEEARLVWERAKGALEIALINAQKESYAKV